MSAKSKGASIAWQAGDTAWIYNRYSQRAMRLTLTIVRDGTRAVWARDAFDNTRTYHSSRLSRTEAEALRREASLTRATVKRRDEQISRLGAERHNLADKADRLEREAARIEQGAA